MLSKLGSVFREELQVTIVQTGAKQCIVLARRHQFTACVSAGAALFPGQLNLHYGDTVPDALSSLNLPPEQLMAHMNQSAIWQQQQPLSDAEICAAAVRVGLLPVRTQRATSKWEGFKACFDNSQQCKYTI